MRLLRILSLFLSRSQTWIGPAFLEPQPGCPSRQARPPNSAFAIASAKSDRRRVFDDIELGTAAALLRVRRVRQRSRHTKARARSAALGTGRLRLARSGRFLTTLGDPAGEVTRRRRVVAGGESTARIAAPADRFLLPGQAPIRRVPWRCKWFPGPTVRVRLAGPRGPRCGRRKDRHGREPALELARENVERGAPGAPRPALPEEPRRVGAPLQRAWRR